MEAFEAKRLPLRKEDLDPSVYVEAFNRRNGAIGSLQNQACKQ